jgi:SM-20-related protein
MPNADFFARLGLFVMRDFLSPELCQRLRGEMSAAEQQQAWTYDYNSGISTINEDARKTREALVFQQTRLMIQSRMLQIKPQIETHFGLSLTGCRKPNFLVYREGDFFRLHRDSPEGERTLESIEDHESDWDRRVSIVVFLNKQTKKPEPGTYGGGALSFYGLIKNQEWTNYGFPLVGDPGSLIAFSPEIYHQVGTISHGERYTIVSWFV